MATEQAAASTWLQTVLSADALLGAIVSANIYSGKIPKGVLKPYPAVVHGWLTAAKDIRTAPNIRIAARPLYIVRGIVQGNDVVSAGILAGHIDRILENASGSNQYGIVASCIRQQPYEMLEESPNGQDFTHAGGMYRLIVQ